MQRLALGLPSMYTAPPAGAAAATAAGVPSSRTRPPSAGAWGGAVPYMATVAASLTDEEEQVRQGAATARPVFAM